MPIQNTIDYNNPSYGIFSQGELDDIANSLSPSAYNDFVNNLSNKIASGEINPNDYINANTNSYTYTTNKISNPASITGRTGASINTTGMTIETSPYIMNGDNGQIAGGNALPPSLADGIKEGSRSSSLSDYGIVNMPHQWTKEADSRLTDSDWRGRAYTQHIILNAPKVIFKVGKPKYMKPPNASDPKAALSAISNLTDNEEMSNMLDQLYEGNKGNQTYYYTFEQDWQNYCNYANSMIRYTAVAMGIDKFAKDMGIKTNYSKFNLFNDNSKRVNSNSWWNDFFSTSMGLTKYIAFYMEGSSASLSEDASNSTTDSQLASGVKTLGQTKRELDFLFGGDSRANQNADSSQDSYATWADNLKKTYTGFSGIDNVINKLSGVATSVMSGANILFPEIWSDSSFRTSFNFELKLHSPYGDKLSIFENIYIPLCLILAMAMPRQSGKQGYTSPFLIQCWSKGWFTVNCGMIDSINIKKGGSSGKEWTTDNFPTEIDISISIKDLYPTIMATSIRGKLAFANNIGLTEYLRTISGIQLTDFDPKKAIQQNLNVLENMVFDIPTNIYAKTQAAIGNVAMKTISKIFGGTR